MFTVKPDTLRMVYEEYSRICRRYCALTEAVGELRSKAAAQPQLEPVIQEMGKQRQQMERQTVQLRELGAAIGTIAVMYSTKEEYIVNTAEQLREAPPERTWRTNDLSSIHTMINAFR